MKLIRLFTMVIFTLCLSSCFIFQPQRMITKNEVSVDKVFYNVVQQFKKAKNEIEKVNIGKHTLTITEADLVLDNVITDEADASLSLLIFKAGYTGSKKRETTVTYSLVATPNAPAPFASYPKRQDALSDLIISSYKQFVNISIDDSVGTFEKDIEIDVAITVDQNGNFEVTGPIGKFTPDVKLSRDVANTQTVKVKVVIDKK